MDKEALRKIIEKMRETGVITNTGISAYVNAMLRAGEIEKIYFVLEKDNLVIFLRSIAKQYARGKKISKYNLKLDVLDEIILDKSLQDEKIMKLFAACMKEDTIEACNTFVHVCDIIEKYKI